MALLALSLGLAVSLVDGFTDYLRFMAEYVERSAGFRLASQFSLGSLLYILAAALYYRLVLGPTARLPHGRRKAVQVIDLMARLVIALTPTIVLLALFLDAHGGSWVMSLAILVLVLSLLMQVAGALVRHPAVLISPASRVGRSAYLLVAPANYLAFLLLPVALASLAIFYLWLWVDVIGATAFIGGLGVLFLFFVLVLAVQRVIASHKRRAKAVASWLVILVLVSHLIPFGARPSEFRHGVVKVEGTSSLPQFVKKRGVPEVSEAFAEWLGSREGYKKAVLEKKKYPVFVVSAQGGGQYAAYHTALFIARLYDRCPRLKDHVFAISGVSGGSVGAAVITEMLRNAAHLDDRCSLNLDGPGRLEIAVMKFFAADFVTPVVASGLLFDLPGLLIPQLRLAPDRAVTLEKAFERAWERSIDGTSWQRRVEGKSTGGLDKSFYGRWTPEGQAPALFFNTTSTNYGAPVVISQLYLAEPEHRSWRAAVIYAALRSFDRTDDGPLSKLIGLVRPQLHRAIEEAIRSSEYTRPDYFNILEYRPELALPLSTAATLSARFPYVTPPGVLSGAYNTTVTEATLRNTGALQLIDGGMWDNSGIGTADAIVARLKSAKVTRELVENVAFHRISFRHARSALQRGGTRAAQGELVAPIATFEAVRQTRRAPKTPKGLLDDIHVVELFDHEFQAPLTWTLSGRVRNYIEARSGGGASPTLCCALATIPRPFTELMGEIIVDLGVAGTALALVDESYLKFVAPNQRRFERIIRLVSDTAGVGSTAVQQESSR
jgi:hypothetical protein